MPKLFPISSLIFLCSFVSLVELLDSGLKGPNMVPWFIFKFLYKIEEDDVMEPKVFFIKFIKFCFSLN